MVRAESAEMQSRLSLFLSGVWYISDNGLSCLHNKSRGWRVIIVVYIQNERI